MLIRSLISSCDVRECSNGVWPGAVVLCVSAHEGFPRAVMYGSNPELCCVGSHTGFIPELWCCVSAHTGFIPELWCCLSGFIPDMLYRGSILNCANAYTEVIPEL
ncbi:hypothetical protein JTB14_023998 [Gonioctena quinquepunctata]|nr:hypothetical protein JTB14_023998 [Gonioctena quinquepunctata]